MKIFISRPSQSQLAIIVWALVLKAAPDSYWEGCSVQSLRNESWILINLRSYSECRPTWKASNFMPSCTIPCLHGCVNLSLIKSWFITSVVACSDEIPVPVLVGAYMNRIGLSVQSEKCCGLGVELEPRWSGVGWERVQNGAERVTNNDSGWIARAI